MQINNMFINSWAFLGTEQIRLKDISGQLIIDDPKKKKKTSAALKGILQAGKTEFLAEAARNNSGADWILSGLLERLPLGSILEGLNKGPLGSQFDLPEGIRKIQINNARFTAYPNRKKFSLEGESNLGKTQIFSFSKQPYSTK